MRLPVSLLLHDSWDDFKIFIKNPYMVLLAFLMALCSAIPNIDISSVPDGVLAIPAMLIIGIILVFQIKLIHHIKTGILPNKDVFIVIPLFIKYLWYSLLLGMVFMLTIIPPIVVYLVFFHSMSLTMLAILFIMFPAILYLITRLGFYCYYIIIDNEKKPVSMSWNVTRKFQWSLMLFYIILFVVEMIIILPLEWGLNQLTGSKTITNLELIPLYTVINLYMMPAMYNVWWFCRNQYRAQQMREGTQVS